MPEDEQPTLILGEQPTLIRNVGEFEKAFGPRPRLRILPEEPRAPWVERARERVALWFAPWLR